MKIVLVLATALMLAALIAQSPGDAAANPRQTPPKPATEASRSAVPDFVQEVIRRAIGLDRLAPLLKKAR